MLRAPFFIYSRRIYAVTQGSLMRQFTPSREYTSLACSAFLFNRTFCLNFLSDKKSAASDQIFPWSAPLIFVFHFSLTRIQDRIHQRDPLLIRQFLPANLKQRFLVWGLVLRAVQVVEGSAWRFHIQFVDRYRRCL